MTARVLHVPYIDQSVRYPTGCESVSAVMLLRFLGMEITVDEFIGRYLEKKAMTEPLLWTESAGMLLWKSL